MPIGMRFCGGNVQLGHVIDSCGWSFLTLMGESCQVFCLIYFISYTNDYLKKHY